jgi:dihydropteroate synthase
MSFTLRNRNQLITIATPAIMGIVNATPDSFYSESRIVAAEGALDQVRKMVEEGAQIIDIGGQSTRPGAERVEASEEIKRVVPIIEAVHAAFPDLLISIDTFYGEVAEAAFQAGAGMVNDVSAWSIDPTLLEVVAKHQLPYVLMHMQGTPQNMQAAPKYDDVVNDVYKFFTEQLAILRQHGVSDVLLDPGFGFGKTLEHNYALLGRLKEFTSLELTLLIGLSRKGMIYKPLNIKAEEALIGTTAANVIALMNGAHVLRVHDVKAAAEAIKIVSLAQES